MTLSPIFGYFGDRISRIPLLFCGIIGWSIAGLFASFAKHYWQFLIFRGIVGIGEASYSVLAPTIIADLYAGAERTRVLGLYSSSIPLGSALGYIYAGEVARTLDWRWAFRITPFVGIALALILVCFVKEPARGDADGIADEQNEDLKINRREAGFSGFIRDVVEIWQVKSFFWSTFGAVGMTFTAGALAQWAPALLQRVNCETADPQCESEITRTFGLVTIVAGVVGCLVGPALSKAYSKRDSTGDAMVSGIALLVATPFVFTALYVSATHYRITWVLILIGETLVSFTWPLQAAIQMSVVAPSLRNTASGVSLTFSHVFGDSVSPFAIGLAADKMYASGKGISRASSLQQALYLCVSASFVAGFFFILCANHLQRDRSLALSNEVSGYRELDTITEDGQIGSENEGLETNLEFVRTE